MEDQVSASSTYHMVLAMGPLHGNPLQSNELISPLGITVCCPGQLHQGQILFQLKKKKKNALRRAVVPVVVDVFQNHHVPRLTALINPPRGGGAGTGFRVAPDGWFSDN